jgi:predicted Zn-dependent protease
MALMHYQAKLNQMDGKPFHYWTTILKECTQDFQYQSYEKTFFYFYFSVNCGKHFSQTRGTKLDILIWSTFYKMCLTEASVQLEQSPKWKQEIESKKKKLTK